MGARLAIAARSSMLGFSALLLVCSCLALASWPAQAGADFGAEFVVPTDLATEPALPVYEQCPEALPAEPLESEDASAQQVYELRREQRTACVAQVERLDQVVARQWWIVSQLLGQQTLAKEGREYSERAELSSEERNELLHELNSAFTPGPLKAELAGVDAENPLPVSGTDGGGEAETAELVAAIDASGEASKGSLYLIAGLLVALFMGTALTRLADRGT